MRDFVLHAHFYQPERLNPWTGELDSEPSAAPARDWNERITRECYHPNGSARIFDERGRIERIVDNYERLSFNFGPTLLSWMEVAHPRTYARILDGDWRSAVRTGRGNALAQAYNHMILPLANDRDRRTQVRWGLADFRSRFQREAEGMWLPETAADSATIDALIDAAVRFTVLAPRQAWRVRAPGGAWRETGGNPDTGKPYRILHSDGSGRSLAVFFYDGDLAQSLAFDASTADSGVLLDRIAASGTDGLISAALDGETFGHHHRFAELGLAYALFHLAEQRGLRPTSYAAYLAEHPPTDEVELVGGEGTSWSCAHGVGRWYRDCGCSTDAGDGWNQAWRTPLRAALDVVRDAAVEAFATRGRELLKDPWAARDDYVEVRLGTTSRQDFLDRHARRRLADGSEVDLWGLLEAQRNAMVMYTSCGWFFADVSGIETVYVLRSATRVLGLLEAAGCRSPREEVLDVLGEAKSNRPSEGTGADVWRRHVEPAEVRPRRLAAHVGLVGLVRPLTPRREGGGHVVEVLDQRSESRGRVTLGTARVLVSSLSTGRCSDFAVAAVHLGGLDFSGFVGPFPGDVAWQRATESLWAQFPTATVAQLLRRMAERIDGEEFGIEQVLPEGRQEVVGAVFSDLTDRFHEQYSRLYHDHRRILEMLTEAGYELPRDLRAAAELTLASELERRLSRALAVGVDAADPSAFDAVIETAALAREQGYALDLQPVAEVLAAATTAATRSAVDSPTAAAADAVQRWLELSGELAVDVDLTEAQEVFADAAVQSRAGRLLPDAADALAVLGAALGFSPVAYAPRR